MPPSISSTFPNGTYFAGKPVSMVDSKEYDSILNNVQAQHGTKNINGDNLSAHLSDCLADTTGSTREEFHATPIAVVGMSFRLPQGLESAESFWEALEEGRSTWSTFPKDRINFDGVYDPDEERLNAFPLKGAHFVDGDISAFDAPFFTIGQDEAAQIDPQSRILLETTYRALENAGVPMEQVVNSRTSVHTGSFGDDYKAFSTRDPQSSGQYASSSVSANMLANRISWFFNLNGESINMDTACSSTLVAFHTACQGLRSGNADMAIVAGANLCLGPDMAMTLNNQKFLSPDGRSWSFDERANGYGRGEGFGALILKRVDDALVNNDPVRAVVRATGTNQDGRTPGIVQPSRKAQDDLIRETYKNAGLDMKLTRYVEAHGTGTPVGDPIEAGAIADAFQACISPDRPLYVGSVKSNVGHLEGTSGISGLIKSVIMLEHGIIPPIAGLETVNPSISQEHPGLKFPKKSCSWPTEEKLRRLSINSFGFGGTNAHVVMDDSESFFRLAGIRREQEVQSSHPKQLGPKMLVFSSQDEKGIGRLEAVYNQHLSRNQLLMSPTYGARLAYTLSERRSALLWRSFAICDFQKGLEKGIELSKPVRALTSPGLALCFTGQGAQWAAMGHELQVFEVYKQSIAKSSAVLKSLGCSWTVENELSRDNANSRINEPEFSQTLCTVCQIALVDLIGNLNLRPKVVLGHSSGEIAAAYSIGAIDRQSAISIAYHRGVLSSKLATSSVKAGGMMSVNLSESEVSTYFETIQVRHDSTGISVGCINSPDNLTITGDLDQIESLREILDDEGIFARKLAVPVAYHSAHMQAVANDYLNAIGDIMPHQEAISQVMISSVTGEAVKPNDVACKEYWVQNMVSPVRFAGALRTAALTNVNLRGEFCGMANKVQLDDVFEIGPHSALQRPIKDTLKAVSRGVAAGYTSALIRNVDSVQSFFNALGYLYSRGHSVDILSLNQLNESHPLPRIPLVNLPEYPFDHSVSYWRESRVSKGYRLRDVPRNDFLGIRVPDWNPQEAKWRSRIRLSEDPWIEDHVIAKVNILPAAGMLVMALEAAKSVSRSQQPDRPVRGYTLRDVSFSQPLKISPDADGTEIEFYLHSCGQSTDREKSWSEFRLYCIENDDWAEACRGRIQVSYHDETGVLDQGLQTQEEWKRHAAELIRIRESCTKTADMPRIYKSLVSSGIDFGPAHQVIKECTYNNTLECFAEIDPHQWLVKARKFSQRDFTVHPTCLDGLFQMGLIATTDGCSKVSPSVVAAIRQLWIAEDESFELSAQDPSKRLLAWNKSTMLSVDYGSADVVALDPSGQRSVIVLDGLEGKILIEEHEKKQAGRLCWNLDYRPDIEMLTTEELFTLCTTGYTIQPPPLKLDHDVKLLLYLCILRTLDKLTVHDKAILSPHHEKFVQWMEREKQKLFTDSPATKGIDFKAVLNNENFYHDLLNELEALNSRGKFYAVLARNLYDILVGKEDPLQLMFQTSLVKHYYHELYRATNGLSSSLAFLDLYAHKNPKMKVLEIGAGTGGMTRNILGVLTQNGSRVAGAGNPRFSHYTYTDISVGFFSDAASMFEKVSDKVTFSVLDIEKDPLKQGFEEAAYDLVIADNVLHATQNLETTLGNVRKLLKPDGKLALFELTDPEVVRTNFAFGLLPGWWRFQDGYRSFSAGVSDKVWDQILKQNGFSGIDLNLQDYDDPVCHEHSALIATAVSEKGVNIPPLPRTLVVLDPSSATQSMAAETLAKRLVALGVPETRIASPEEASSMSDLSEWFCITIFDLEESSWLASMTEAGYEQIKTLLRADGGFLWVNSGGGVRPERPEHSLIQGALRCLRMEERHSKFITLSLDTVSNHMYHAVDRIMQVYEAVVTRPVNDCEQEYVERDGHLNVDRFIEADYINMNIDTLTEDTHRGEMKFGDHPNLSLTVASPGLLDSLEFVDNSFESLDLAPSEIEIMIEASGVNFRDCLIALGRLSGTTVGFECAGTITRKGCDVHDLRIGDRVCASALGTYQTFTRCDASDAILIPDSMTYVEGSTLPVVFTTAFYALVHVANIQPGESVLIHSAAGGTGQAAIQVAQMRGAEIFVTVGSHEKKQLLMELFNIPENHIFDSRNTSFVKGLQGTTGKGGVDVILNSLSGDFLTESWNLIAPFGRFLELGKKDILSNGSLPMLPFSRNASFHAIDLKEARRYRPRILRQLRDDITSLLEKKQISPPQPIHVYGIGQVEQAFRYLQSGKNTGKTVVELRHDDFVKINLKPERDWDFQYDATYVIAGGLGGLGCRTASWMAQRGAKNLILLSRSGPSNSEARELVYSLQRLGVRVEAPKCDISDFKSLESVLVDLQSRMPPIKGCIQSTMVIRAKIFENMSYQDWNDVYNCKVPGTRNLHKLLPTGMDFFIMYSSISGGVGGTASFNYSAACAYQDAFTHYRNAQGEKATTFNLGVMVDDGALRDKEAIREALMGQGYLIGIHHQEMCALLEYHCNPSLPIPSTPLESQVIVGIETPLRVERRGGEFPIFMNRPLFSGTWNITNADTSIEETATSDVVKELAGAGSTDEAAEIITQALMQRLSKLLGVPLENLDPSKEMYVYGVDSLVAVELRNWFKWKLEAELAVFEILGKASFEVVGALVASRSQVVAIIVGDVSAKP